MGKGIGRKQAGGGKEGSGLGDRQKESLILNQIHIHKFQNSKSINIFPVNIHF